LLLVPSSVFPLALPSKLASRVMAHPLDIEVEDVPTLMSIDPSLPFGIIPSRLAGTTACPDLAGTVQVTMVNVDAAIGPVSMIERVPSP